MIDTRPAPAEVWRRPGRDAEPAPSGRPPVAPPQAMATPVAPGTPRFHLAHLPALDGLRGVAIIAVLLFHTQLLTGGYLGIELFFSLSGFLITSLLLEERITTHAIRLKDFWLRRARRLLPALIGLLVGVTVYARFFGEPAQVLRLRGDAPGTLLYVANWHSILAGQSYWDLFSAPSLLEHTWSLAIEEQFYLVWPLILATLLWWGRGSLKVIVAFALAMAAAGGVWMAVVYEPNDVSRAYLGTDTRMPALLLGAALAAWLQWRGPTRSYRVRLAIEVVTLVGVAVLVLMWALLDGSSALVYRGGLVVCSVAGVALLASASHPASGPVAAALSWRPLRWLGLISYGLYLWHWPVIVVLSPERTGLTGPGLVAVQVAVSLVLAMVSYVVLEQPIRQRGLRAWTPSNRLPIAAGLSIGLALLLVLLPVSGTVEQQAAAALQQTDSAALARAPLPIQSDDPIARAAPAKVVSGQPLPRLVSRQPREMIVGDSVSLSLGLAMDQEPDRWKTKIAQRSIVGCTIDSGTGRTRSSVGVVHTEDPTCRSWPTRWADDVKSFRPDAVLVAFGGLETDPRLLDDGAYHAACDSYYLGWYRRQWDRALQVLSSQGAIVFVAPPANINLPTRWPGFNDGADCVRPVLRDAVAANPNARLIALDTWVCPTRATCRDEENGYQLRFDGVHYAGKGASVTNEWIQGQIFVPPQ